MSIQDHVTARSPTADEPSTPTSSSPQRRDCEEDANANFTRKRPRLDNGAASLRAMSTEPGLASILLTSPHKEMVAMTIQERMASSPSPVEEDGIDQLPTGLSTSRASTPTTSPPVMDGAQDERTSPPVIEIFNDEDSAELPANFLVHLNADDHFRHFPFHEHFGGALEALHGITVHVQKNSFIPPDLLPLLAQWLQRLPNDPSTCLQTFYVTRVPFWCDFANLVDKLLRRRYHWMTALDAGQDDDISRFPFGDRFGDDGAVDEAFSAFFSAYMKLCSHLFLVDVHLLNHPRYGERHGPSLTSEKHLQHLHTILLQEKMPLFHLLRREHALDVRKLSNRLHTAFLSAEGAQSLLGLAGEALCKVSTNMQNSIAVLAPQVLGTLGWTVCQFESARGGIDPDDYYRGTLLFLRKYTEDLQDPAKITDASTARDKISNFFILIQEICQWDSRNATILADELLDFQDSGSPIASPTADTGTNNDLDNYRQYPDLFPVLVANAWKFKLLRKYIVKGRMELRVMSIAAMDAGLIELHREYNRIDPKHPVLRYLADILLRGRVVDYIISVDSHPQLISRSGNIAGFLVATDRWEDSQADAIWNTVSHSTDPRVVAATMAMLRNIIGLMSFSDHLYLCLKIYYLPIQNLTLDILQFLQEVTEKVLNSRTLVDWNLRAHNARPWNVYVRLLQDTASKISTTKHNLDLNVEAYTQLRSIAHSIPEEDQIAIYERCLEEINSRSDLATGSVEAILILISTGKVTLLRQHQSLVRQVLEEIPWFIKTETDINSCQLPALQYRLELLASLACSTDQLVPPDLYQTLWDHTVGKDALSNAARDLAWTQFSESIKVSPANDFCYQLITTYVPIMDPDHYTPGLYEFVSKYDFPVTRKIVKVDGADQLVLQIPGGSLLWALVLLSPQGTIEEMAARELALRYTRIVQDEKVTLPEIEATHVELVEQCMDELRSAFTTLSGERDRDYADNKARFRRVLTFQKQMLELVRQTPEFNRSRRADSKVEAIDESVIIKYQFENDRQSLLMAPHDTVNDLYRRLCRATGCTKIRMFASGRKLDTTQHGRKISEANISGQLLIQAIEKCDRPRTIFAPIAGSSEYEANLLKHFDEMFMWMDGVDATSQLLFDFLTLFPYPSSITESVITGEATPEDLFPKGKFFQAKYAAQAIHSKLYDQSYNSAVDQTFLVNAVKLLDRALLASELSGSATSQELALAAVLVGVMLDFLRERSSLNLAAVSFSDASALANRLIDILLAACQSTGGTTVIEECYATILEASLYSSAVWLAFWKHPEVTHIHRTLLLVDKREDLREHIKTKIQTTCNGDLPASSPLNTADIASRYWNVISVILPETTYNGPRSTQLFQLAEDVFRVHDAHNRTEDSLCLSLHDWSTLLLAYDHAEIPGQYRTDNVVLGLTRLVLCLIPSLKFYNHPLNASNLISSLFEKFLFTKRQSPNEAESHDVDYISAPLPSLESNTRRQLYDLVLSLVDDNSAYDRLLQITGEVENRNDDNILPTVTVDRSLEIRSRTGYVGLQNPRAICYMNSLLTQLFMNLDFRQFMLGLEVKQGDGPQRLLLETQKLFAAMQESYRKAADPRPFAACVQTLDKTPIDIGVQMDADEFYNLLFDQWEAQIVSEHDKQRFRNFYGGQMLQQVKSKECQHVSERADSFFALQCDVQGKANLQESLQSFVQGDVMEGDNKYKCESCGGKFVDAVKRTCLKSAPDNLIFHLKRFDFDLTDFSRKKVHERFGFPETIDIGLYNVNHLSDPSKQHTEDLFDLVGVVVHFGNCENGHYYSYIRERPSPMGEVSPTWLNFNDQEVDPFDPTEIPQKAFGGVAEDSYTRQYKLYSAYMLFYQRRTTIANDQHGWAVSSHAHPPRVAVPQPMKRDIDLENELFIQEYCILDPQHSAFIQQLHGALRKINHGICSETHDQETHALDVFLAHIGRVVYRHQNTDIFEEAVAHLRQYVLSCKVCCDLTLQWLAQDDEALHNLLLRCPHPNVRSQIRSFLVESLRYLRHRDPIVYGLTSSTSDPDLQATCSSNGTIHAIAKRLMTVAGASYRHTRAWDDFYLTLTQIAELGISETAALLNAGIFDMCLRLFCMHARTRIAEQYIEFVRVLEKRKNIFNRLIGFLYTVLSRMDINQPVCSSGRLVGTEAKGSLQQHIPFTEEEKALLLCWHNGTKAFAVVDKMVELFDETKTSTFYPGKIVEWMAKSNDEQIQRRLTIMIVQGITELNVPFCNAYLQVATCYCEALASINDLSKVCDIVIDTIATIDRSSDEENTPSGENVLRFFEDVCKMSNQNIAPTEIYSCFVTKCDRFAIPLLLHSNEAVRNGACTFVYNLYETFMHNSQNTQTAYKYARIMAAELIKRFVYESSFGTLRSHLTALLDLGKFFVQMLHELDASDDPDLDSLKDENDKALVYQWQFEVESRVRTLPEGSTPRSMGEGMFDRSDYGSDSDDVELLDP